MKAKVIKNRNMTIEDLMKGFSTLDFKFMGDLHKYPGSAHYHVTSREQGKTGVVEITFFEESNTSYIELKLATNRVGTWGEEGFNQFERYLEVET